MNFGVTDDDLLQDRREHFQVVVERELHMPGNWRLRVTHNGIQWSSLQLDDHEIPLVIAALQEVAKEVNGG